MDQFSIALRILCFPLAIAGIVFTSAGRIDLPFVWAICGEMLVLYLCLAAFTEPDLWKERQSPAGTNLDRLTQPLGAVFLLSHWIIAGLDIGRFHWSPIPWQVQFAGIFGYALALAVNFWAMRVNRFYSSVVRVQEDRGHRPIMDGPYRFVRHPGYAATLFAMFSGGMALGSWVAMIPVVGFALLFLRRTLLEDQMLHRDLAGYSEYARRVKFRLVPGIF